jgi:hypothetical protein
MANACCSLLHRIMATEPQRHITLGSPLSNETTPTRLGLPYTSDRSVQNRKLACRTLYIKCIKLFHNFMAKSIFYIFSWFIPSIKSLTRIIKQCMFHLHVASNTALCTTTKDWEMRTEIIWTMIIQLLF